MHKSFNRIIYYFPCFVDMMREKLEKVYMIAMTPRDIENLT